MRRGRTGAALIGAVMALMVGGSVASAGPDASVPESSVPESAPETSAPDVTVPVETSLPVTEPTALPGRETYTISVSIDADEAFLTAQDASVALHAPGATDPLADAVPCTSVPVCQRFDVPPGDYRLTFSIESSEDGSYFLWLGDGHPFGMSFDVSVVDSDVELRFGLGGIGRALPIPTSTTTTTTAVASGGPVPVAELPETGSNGRLGVASLLLISVGVGCVVAARRRPV